MGGVAIAPYPVFKEALTCIKSGCFGAAKQPQNIQKSHSFPAGWEVDRYLPYTSAVHSHHLERFNCIQAT